MLFFLHICLTIFCTFPAANRKYVFSPAIISVFCIPTPLSIHHQSTPCVCDSSVSPIPPCSKTQRVMGFVGGKTIRVKINSLVFRPTQPDSPFPIQNWCGIRQLLFPEDKKRCVVSSSQKSQFASKCLPERKEGRARSVDKFTEEQKGDPVQLLSLFLCFFSWKALADGDSGGRNGFNNRN